jgi:hypothetical protein
MQRKSNNPTAAKQIMPTTIPNDISHSIYFTSNFLLLFSRAFSLFSMRHPGEVIDTEDQSFLGLHR